MKTLLLVLGAVFMLVVMAIAIFLLGVIARGPYAESFKPYSFVLVASLFTLPVAWVLGYLFSRREAANENRPAVVRHWLSLPFYAVSVHGILWAVCISFGLK